MPHVDANDSSDACSRRIPAHIRVKNRRKTYLDQNPSYFRSPDLELSNPILYDRCIRRFQTAAEREADGKQRGYSGVLEAGLYLGEARQREREDQRCSPTPEDAEIGTNPSHPLVEGPEIERDMAAELEDGAPKTKEEGFEIWKVDMTLKFLGGLDQDFDYEFVDGDTDLDVVEAMEEEERWFDEEEPEWRNNGDDGRVRSTDGETGVQDY